MRVSRDARVIVAVSLIGVAAGGWLLFRRTEPPPRADPVVVDTGVTAVPALLVRAPPAPVRASDPPPTPVPEPLAPSLGPVPAPPSATTEPSTLPVAVGRAVFEDGTPVANAALTLTLPLDRVVLATARTDADGAFRLPVPGFGPASFHLEFQGMRFEARANVGRDAVVRVPSATLSVRLDSPRPGASLFAVALVVPPAVARMQGLSKRPVVEASYRDKDQLPYPSFRVPLDEEVRVRVPRVGAVLLWASAGPMTSEVVQVDDPAAADPIELRLRETISVPVVLREEKGRVPREVLLELYGDRVPAVDARAVEGRATLAGLVPGKTYGIRSANESVEVVRPISFTADRGKPIDVLVRALTATEFLVVDGTGAPIADACIGAWKDVKGSTTSAAVRTGAEGRVTLYTNAWSSALVHVDAPPGTTTGSWEGRLKMGESHRIEIDQPPYTTVRIRPTDCVVSLSQNGGDWIYPGTATLGVTQDAMLVITSGGRYLWQRVAARELAPGQDEIELTPAMKCRISAPAGATSVRVMMQGVQIGVPGVVVVQIGTGEFEAQGLEGGTRVSAVGRCGPSNAPCTERVEFTVQEGQRVVLPPLARAEGAR